MTLHGRIWQITQALALTAGVAGFLLVAGAYGLLVFFAHDAQVPRELRAPGAQRVVTQSHQQSVDAPR